jgi:hypothetical protein
MFRKFLRRIDFGETRVHRILLCLSLLLSLGGMAAGYFLNNPDLGPRGGAVAVAISLFALFANRQHGKEAYEVLTSVRARLNGKKEPTTAQALTLEKLSQQLDDIVLWISIDLEGQAKQNFYMSIAAFTGTIVWGFGDWVDKWLLGLPVFPE